MTSVWRTPQRAKRVVYNPVHTERQRRMCGDCAGAVLQSQADIIQEELFFKGHFVNLCGVGSLAVYERCYDDGPPDSPTQRSRRFVIKFKPTIKVSRLIQHFNANGTPEGVTYTKFRVTQRIDDMARYFINKAKQ